MWQGRIPPRERAALVDLFYATGGPDWIHGPQDGWLVGEPCNASTRWGTWPFIRCVGAGDVGHVSTIELKGNGLKGDTGVPASLGNLSGLTYLDIDTSSVTGPIPATLCDAANLSKVSFRATQRKGASIVLLNLGVV